jgi:hypothetical protein
MYQTAQLDPLIVNYSPHERRYAYDNANPTKFLADILGAYHYAFSDYICTSYDSIENCMKSSPPAQVIAKYSGAFLDRYVKQDQSAMATLTSSDQRLSNYEYEVQ